MDASCPCFCIECQNPICSGFLFCDYACSRRYALSRGVDSERFHPAYEIMCERLHHLHVAERPIWLRPDPSSVGFYSYENYYTV